MKLLSILAAAALATSVRAADPVTPGVKPWSYKTNDPSVYSPAQWGQSVPACDGKRQSPIAIETKGACGKANAPRTKVPISFTGACSEATVKEYDDAYKATPKDGTGCQLKLASNDKTYSFAQSHYHAPSEHTLNGKTFDAEIHFVHSRAADDNLVVGLFIQKKEGATTDPYLLKFFDSAPGVNPNATAEVSLGSFFPAVETSLAAGRVFNYPGSLTNPPCAESVDWWVVEKPLVVSPSDFEKMHKELLRLSTADEGKTARPVQALNGRTITTH